MKNFGIYSFYIGIFLLPSAFSISAGILLIAAFLGFFINDKKLFEDKFNYLFFIGIIFLFLSSIYNSFNFVDVVNQKDINTLNNYIGLFNWIPLILCFYGFQPYLKSEKMRKNTCLLFLFGSIPVFASILGQVFFEWHGPLKTLNGLIVWYQRPLYDGMTRITGLFNNQNYLASWLLIIWPFSLALFYKKEKFFIIKIVTFLFLLFIALSIILTASRAALFSLIFSIPILFGFRSLKIFIPILIFISSIFLFIFIPIFGEGFQSFMQNFIPTAVWNNFNSESYGVHLSRTDLWRNALEMIYNNPLFGSGALSFPRLLEANTGIWSSHPHNLPLELMVNYGIPTTIFIITPFTIILFKGYFEIFIRNNIYFKENLFDRAWITSLILICLANLVDITYFDGRISIACWALLSGVRNITLKKA
tara:strand:+ start:5643 stop:6902 length:1260 start_codon:yes stop_codon:yes gene_type:complete